MPLPRDTTPSAPGPLVATLARLDESDSDCSYFAGDPPESDGGGWYRVDEMLDDDQLLDDWFQEVLDVETKGRRDVAASYLASFLTGTVADAAIKAIATESRVWPLEPSILAVRRGPTIWGDGPIGWFDGIAVRTTRLRVLPDDPDASHPEVEVVADRSAMHAVVAEELVALAAQSFAAVRQRARFGLRGMWGNFVDGIAAGILWYAHKPGSRCDPRAGFAIAAAVVDEIANRAPLVTVRPRLDRVDWSGGTRWVIIRGNCCLQYKTFDVREEGYCASCCFRDDDSRRAVWASYCEAWARGAGDSA